MHTEVSASPNIIGAQNSSSRSSNWRLWCRLCAKEDLQGNINIYFKDEQNGVPRDGVTTHLNNVSELSLATAIGKYFWVEMKRDEELPKMLCTECFSLVTSLVNFSERVAKVQQMFCVLHNTPTETQMDLHTLRLKYGLLDEEREHVLIQQQLPEVHYFEAKPKVNDLGERTLENDSSSTVLNPLEQARIKVKIKKEDIIKDMDDLDDDNDSLDHDNTLNEDYSENNENEDGNCRTMKSESSANTETQCMLQSKKQQSQGLVEGSHGESIVAPPRKRRMRHRRRKPPLLYEEDECDVDAVAENDGPHELERLHDADNMDAMYACNDCPRKFKRVQHFRQHMNRAHAKETDAAERTCAQCPKVFSTMRQLEAHAKVHLPPELRKVVPCPYCHKKFSSHTLMQTHIKYIHMNERPFICEECGVAVRTNAALKTHMLTHTDYAPFECEVCKKGFKNQIRLKNHMETHDPNKHICAECGLQLNSRATLNRHLLVHSDEMLHKCDYCGRAFKRAKALKNHLILHTGLKPYSCDFCDRTFANGSNCRSHKKKAHPGELAALEAAGGGKTYTRNIPKLEALKAVTKAADNLAPVVSKQSGRFAFGKKSKVITMKEEGLDNTSKVQMTTNGKESASASTSTSSPVPSPSPVLILTPTVAAVPTIAVLNNAPQSAVLQPNASLVACNSHISPATIPNIDNIYTHIMKHASIAAQTASNTELTMHIKRPPSEASSCAAMEQDAVSSELTSMQSHQQLQTLQQQASPSVFYTHIVKQSAIMPQEQQQLHHHLQQHQQHLLSQQQQQQQQHLHTPSAEDIGCMRSPDSQASSHITEEHSNPTVTVQFYNHIRQNLQSGPFI